jgi:hypothetical protein
VIGKLVLASGATLFLAGAALIGLSPIAPVAWTPPQPYLPADACSNGPVASARVLASGLPGKPDGLAFAPDGRLLAALTNGQVAAVDRQTGAWTIAASGGGFLTGLAAARDGTIYAVDERAGALLAAPLGGRFRTVVDRVGKVRLRWTNDVTVASDGNVYLTTTATGRNLDAFFLEVLEHRGSGLLLRYDPASAKTRVIADGLQMTNGLAATQDGALLVAQSAVYGVGRFQPDGARGAMIYGLPGFTGNIRASDRPGVFWLTLLSPRSGLIDGLAGQPWARRLLAWLPDGARPGPRALPCLIELSMKADTLQARAVRISGVDTSFSTAIERGGKLYLSPASIAPGSRPSLFMVKLQEPISGGNRFGRASPQAQ